MSLVPLLIVTILFLSGLTLPWIRTPLPLTRTSALLQGAAACLMVAALPALPRTGGVTFTLGASETLWGLHWQYGLTEVLMAAVFSAIAAAIMAASEHLLQELPPARTPLYVMLFHLVHGAILGILLTGHLFNGFFLLELIGLSSAALIALKDKEQNLKAALKYLLFSTVGSGLVLMGIACLHGPTGLMTLQRLKEAVPGLWATDPALVSGSLMCFTAGLGIKGALFPLHLWLPDAHSFAPTPVSALLSALVIKAPPFFLLKLTTQVFSPAMSAVGALLSVLTATAAVGVLAASLLARSQTHLKRMIAYSSVSQIGYVFLGISLGTGAGAAMALYHMIAHGLAKSLMFLSAGTLIAQTGSAAPEALRGIGKEMPVTLGFFCLSAFSMVGIPVLPGFISKFALALAAIEAGRLPVLAVILLSSLLTAAYYFPLIINGFFGEDNLRDRISLSKLRPAREQLPLAALALLLVLAGAFSGTLLEVLEAGMTGGVL